MMMSVVDWRNDGSQLTYMQNYLIAVRESIGSTKMIVHWNK